MKPKDFDKWNKIKPEQIEQMFARTDQLRIHAPSGTLFDELEFVEYVDFVFEKIDTSESFREIILEAWLLIDYIITYLLRDALQIPERIENELKLLPFSFDAKIELIKKLRKAEEGKMPNQKSYWAFELHPGFQSELMKDKELHKRFLKIAGQFEAKTFPQGAVVLMRHDFEQSRFVPEWWYARVTTLDDEWFQNCKRLNKARNIAVHKRNMDEYETFVEFGASSLADFKIALKKIIELILFRHA